MPIELQKELLDLINKNIENWKVFFSCQIGDLKKEVHERIDRHGAQSVLNNEKVCAKVDKLDGKVDKIDEKVDELKDYVHKVELDVERKDKSQSVDSERKDKAIWIKIAEIMGIVTASSGVSIAISHYASKGV